jgi:predicted chitinase
MENYARTGKLLHIDLVADPDKMLDPLLSARVLIEGLIDGRWNGQKKGIAWYLPDNGADDLKNARRTVNITDKWALIAGYYRTFLAALEAAKDKGE